MYVCMYVCMCAVSTIRTDSNIHNASTTWEDKYILKAEVKVTNVAFVRIYGTKRHQIHENGSI
jgi:hypothetical protein